MGYNKSTVAKPKQKKEKRKKMNNDTENNNDTNISAIDAALAMAKAGRVAKPKPSVTTTSAAQEQTDNTTNNTVDREEQRLQREAQRAERAKAIEERRAQREAAREAKRAAREAAREGFVPHMKKVEKAAAGLPALPAGTTSDLFDEMKNLSPAELSTLLAHGELHLRAESTKLSAGVALDVGQRVRVTAGPSGFLGMEGTITKVSRIRAHVAVDGSDRVAYCFTSDLSPIAQELDELDEHEGDEELAGDEGDATTEDVVIAS